MSATNSTPLTPWYRDASVSPDEVERRQQQIQRWEQHEDRSHSLGIITLVLVVLCGATTDFRSIFVLGGLLLAALSYVLVASRMVWRLKGDTFR